MAAKDYYEILGVARSADEAEIKHAYRKMAKQYHPDKNPGNKQAEQKFKDVNEAFSILGNKRKREQYDAFGANGPDMGAPGFGADFSNVFDGLNDVFGGAFSDLFGERRQRGRQGGDLRYEITIDFAEAYKGITKNIRVPLKETCSRCHGTGAKDDKSIRECDHCKGAGVLRMQRGMFTMQQTCRACGGRGSVVTAICPACGGEGMTSTHKDIKVVIPAGIDDGNNLRLSNQGNAVSGGPAGDLYIQVRVRPHPFFLRRGQDLLCELPISIMDAALGGTVELESLQGKLSLRIPPGTQSDKTLRLRGRGIPHLKGGQTGDLLCAIRVETPVNLNSEQQELLRRLGHSLTADQTNHSPRPSNWKDKVRSFFH